MAGRWNVAIRRRLDRQELIPPATPSAELTSRSAHSGDYRLPNGPNVWRYGKGEWNQRVAARHALVSTAAFGG